MKRWFLSWFRAFRAYWRLRKLLSSPMFDAVKYAVDKTRIDISFSGTEDHLAKRTEAELWSRLYAKEYGIQMRSTALVNLLIEYHVAVRKGYL